MTKRELYKDKYQAMIQQWTAQLEALSARQDVLTAEAKLAAQPHVDTVTRGLEQARGKLIQFGHVTDDKWEDFTEGVDAWWTETRAALEGAFDALAPPPSSRSQEKQAS